MLYQNSQLQDPAVKVKWMTYLWAPNAFCKEILGQPNDPWQRAVFAEIAKDDGHPEVLIQSCHGPGKTNLAAKLILWSGVMLGRVRIPCVAPKEDTLKDKLWPEIHKILLGADPIITSPSSPDQVVWTKTKILFRGGKAPGHEATIETAPIGRTEGMSGHHEDRVMVIVEEASGITDEFWPVIDGWCTTPGSKVFSISNPTRTTGRFARRFRKPNASTKLFRVAWAPTGVEDKDGEPVEERSTTAPYLDRTDGGAEVETWYSKRPTDKWAQQIIEDEGWEGSVTRVRVRGLPPVADDEALISRAFVWDAYGREPIEDGAIHQRVISWDVAGAGRDKSILSERAGTLVKSIVDLKEDDPIRAARALEAEFDDDMPDQVNVDATGIGDGPLHLLQDDGYSATQVMLGGGADNSEEYSNARAELYWEMRQDFIKGRICLSSDIPQEMIEKLAEELEATAWDYSPMSNKIRIQDKRDIKRKIKRSPDIADVLMLFYASPCGGVAPASGGEMVSAGGYDG